MTLKRIGLTGSVNRQARITGRRITLNRVSLRRFPFPSTAAAVVNYVEDVFSTHLYVGNSPSSPPTAQTITNNINLADNGGLVWIKSRSQASWHALFDTSRGVNRYLFSNNTDTSTNFGADFGITAFNSNGFTVKGGTGYLVNQSGVTYGSWTFRKQAKFFDVVTYTGNGVSGTQISHNLGSTPGCIIVKKTDGATTWAVYHRGLSGNEYLNLNNTDSVSAIGSGATVFGNGTSLVAPTSSVFTVGTSSQVNSSGGAYIAYLFAHDAGGFGAAGSDNVISCGSFVPSSGAATVTLGYEPQFVILRNSSAPENWIILDTMRGWVVTSGGESILNPNLSDAESGGNLGNPTATGFVTANLGTGTYIYIAIRRGPMKTPTSGTDVFSLASYTGDGSSGLALNSGIVSDTYLVKRRTGASSGWKWMQRLISYPSIGSYGPPTALDSASTAAESGAATWSFSRNQNYNTDYFEAAQDGSGNWFVNGSTYINYALRRAPGFFDVVCYTGTGSATNITHNLGVAPELLIIKRRTSSGGTFTDNWAVWTKHATPQQNDYSTSLNLNTAWSNEQGGGQVLYWGASQFGTPNMTSTTFSIGTYADVNANAATYVAYLFASVAGVSKVGTYTGDGSSQTINCGFTTGARFIVIKRIDTTNGWYVWDTARGIVSGNDPWLNLNATSTEIGTSDSVDPDNTGFIVNQLIQTDINANGGKYLFLAIA
jgi:hypothetical protein